jgi:hypothetical protein
MPNDLTTENPLHANLDRYVWPGGAALAEGDFMFLPASTDELVKASQWTWDTNLATTVAAAGPRFVGLASGGYPSSQEDEVDPFGVIPHIEKEVDCTSSTFEIGNLVSPADSGASTMENQKVAKTTDPTAAIGVVVKRYASATTRVRVRFRSRLLPLSPPEYP